MTPIYLLAVDKLQIRILRRCLKMGHNNLEGTEQRTRAEHFKGPGIGWREFWTETQGTCLAWA